MSDFITGIVVALITGFFGLIAYCITLWGTKKIELKKIKEQSREDLKKLEMQMDREDMNARREFLALTIKDETQSAGVRRAAAREYLEKGYNGVVKQFIYETGLDK